MPKNQNGTGKKQIAINRVNLKKLSENTTGNGISLIFFYPANQKSLCFGVLMCNFSIIQPVPERKKTYKELQEEEKARKAALAPKEEVRLIFYTSFNTFNSNSRSE